MGLRSPGQRSPADAAAQSFLRSAGQFRDAAGKARCRAGGAEVTRRLHRIGGRLVSCPCELRPSLIFKTQAMRGSFWKKPHTGFVAVLDIVAIAPSDGQPISNSTCLICHETGKLGPSTARWSIT